jgi:pilus assembly protein CpaF
VAAVAAGRTPRQVLADLINRTAEQESVRAGFFREDLQHQVMDFLFGYGPLQPYVEDENISDIDGTGPAEFSIKTGGRRQAIPLAFPDRSAYDTFCRLVIIRNGGIINENDSHCRVTDEKLRLRINVTVPPRSVNGASISIRKHRQQSWGLQDLVGQRMLTAELAGLLQGLAASDATVVFCGKGAAGKTTLMRAFIHALPQFERVLIAESDSEIYPERPYCLVQRIKRSNEGGRPVSLRDLVADGLTMSLDTYCIGEIVGSEAMEFMRAAFSGHRCLATTHAECAADALDRLLTLARPAAQGENDRTLRSMLARSINYVVFLKNFQVRQVMKIHGYRESEDRYEMAEIWPAQ